MKRVLCRRAMRRVAIFGVLLLLTACEGGELRPRAERPTTSSTRVGRPTTTTEFVGPGSVGGPFPSVTELAHPVVAERDPNRGAYVREEWDGKGWADDDGDGCNTRAEVLEAEATGPVTRKTTNCTVLTGAWTDHYTGLAFTDAAQVQIDHLVALSDASASGGWAWSADRKRAFTNDLDDAWQLNVTSGAENQRKADRGPDQWVPPAESFRCTYVAAYAGIKARWGLTVTPSQWAAVVRVWSRCG